MARRRDERAPENTKDAAVRFVDRHARIDDAESVWCRRHRDRSIGKFARADEQFIIRPEVLRDEIALRRFPRDEIARCERRAAGADVDWSGIEMPRENVIVVLPRDEELIAGRCD